MTQALDRIMKITERPPLVMVEGAGSWLWDRDGKRIWTSSRGGP